MAANGKYIIHLITVLSTMVSYTQTVTPELLKEQLLSAKANQRIDLLNDISKSFYTIHTDSAFCYARLALQQSRETHYWQGESDALNNMGVIYRERQNFDSAEMHFRSAVDVSHPFRESVRWCRDQVDLGNLMYLEGKYESAIQLINVALPVYQLKHDKRNEDYCYRMLGTIYTCKGFYERAFTLFQKSFSIGSTVKDPKGSHSSTYMWNTYLIASLYKEAGDTPTSLQYYQLSVARARQNGSMVDYYRLLGDIASVKNLPDSAVYYYSKEVDFNRKRIADATIAKTFATEPLMRIGENYLLQRNYRVALRYFLGQLPVAGRSSENTFVLRTLQNLSKAYDGVQDYNNALTYARQSLERAKRTGTRQYLRDGYELCWKHFERVRNTDSAYSYYLSFINMRDSIAKDLQLRNIAIAQMQSWKEKKDLQIRVLETEKKIKSQHAKALLFLLAVIIILSGFVFWNVLLKRKNAVNLVRSLDDRLKLQHLQAENERIQFEREKSELEMKALRAQMNPHFIFNSLNAINRFILENDRMLASTYLTRFSRLVRMILQHSQERLIPLQNELDALQIYLELEALRFDNYFTYKVHTDPLLDTASLQIPPMIIQPYVENAIWHGLMHKNNPGMLTIDISQEADMLICSISDDGIGREQAVVLKSKSASSYKSMGMRITEERISRTTLDACRPASVHVQDIILADGLSGGTTVILKIPVVYA